MTSAPLFSRGLNWTWDMGRAGLTDHVWTFEEIANIIDAAIEKPAKRGPYKKKLA